MQQGSRNPLRGVTGSPFISVCRPPRITEVCARVQAPYPCISSYACTYGHTREQWATWDVVPGLQWSAFQKSRTLSRTNPGGEGASLFATCLPSPPHLLPCLSENPPRRSSSSSSSSSPATIGQGRIDALSSSISIFFLSFFQYNRLALGLYIYILLHG